MQTILKKTANSILSQFGLKLIKHTSDKSVLLPVEASNYERNLITECGQYSMTGPIRMWALVQSINYVRRNSIAGDFVECGVWKGGNLALMQKMVEMYKLDRKVYGFDTFEGMSEPTEHDIDYAGNLASKMMEQKEKIDGVSNVHAFAGLSQVKQNLASVGITDSVKLVQGKVEDTLQIEENIPAKISILRLDTDWYESTKFELERLYPRLTHGGVLIIDDYGHFQGAKKAVDEFFEDLGEDVWLHYIDYTCRLMIKRN